MEKEFDIIPRKGGEVLLNEGHQFYRHKEYKNKSIIWYCQNRRKLKCTGSLTIINDAIIKKEVEHIEECKADFSKNALALSIASLKQEAGTSTESLPRIFKKHKKVLKDKGLHFVTKLPSFQNVKCSLYAARKEKFQVNKTVYTDLSEVEIPVKYRDFLIADYQYEDTRMLVFCTDEAKQLLGIIKEYFGDATFKSAPQPFYQLFTIHGDMGSTSQTTNIVPLIYALMSDKKESSYSALFDILKTRFSEWNPSKFHADFEISITNAILIRKFFENITIKKCYAHFTKCLWKKSKSIGIKAKLYTRIVGLCTALPLLPDNLILDGWNYIEIQSTYFNDKKLEAFKKYMVNTWLKKEDEIKEWCVYNERHRTNNVTENWHSELNRKINKNYVTVAKLLNVLQDEITISDMDIINEEANDHHNDRRRIYIEKDNLIHSTQKKLIQNELTVGQFLETLR